MALATDLLDLLLAVDGDFTPALSSRLALDDYASKLAEKATVFSVFSEGRMSAFAALYCNDPEGVSAFLSMVAVDPQRRGTGLAMHLLGAAIDYLRQQGFAVLRLEVYPDNAAALRLYEKLGFERKAPTSTAIPMELALSATPVVFPSKN